MSLQHLGTIELPENVKPGGFDHAAVHESAARLFVAHTCNDALDVIDCAADRYLHSIPGLTGVAGALVSEERNLVFSSNRGENTVGIFSPDNEAGLVKVTVGVRPNGLAFAPSRNLLLAANVGTAETTGSYSVSLVDVAKPARIEEVAVPGRTHWAIYDLQTDAFYVNIADPARIVVIDAETPDRIARVLEIPASGPHGLDLDEERRRLFCTCDGRMLVTLDIRSGSVQDACELSGVPDVLFFNAARRRLYVAIGDPGVIEVFDTEAMQRRETVTTEQGAHTIGFDASRNKVYAFLPLSHRAAVYADSAD